LLGPWIKEEFQKMYAEKEVIDLFEVHKFKEWSEIELAKLEKEKQRVKEIQETRKLIKKERNDRSRLVKQIKKEQALQKQPVPSDPVAFYESLQKSLPTPPTSH
jgi:16S rRNA C967 or C1407 C5-methylase (RsmB/RsmF family)